MGMFRVGKAPAAGTRRPWTGRPANVVVAINRADAESLVVHGRFLQEKFGHATTGGELALGPNAPVAPMPPGPPASGQVGQHSHQPCRRFVGELPLKVSKPVTLPAVAAVVPS
jgi:hypothetical protein